MPILAPKAALLGGQPDQLTANKKY